MRHAKSACATIWCHIRGRSGNTGVGSRYPWIVVMEVRLTPDQQAFARQAVKSGRLDREEDAVKEALSLWEERERRRLEILAAVDEAEASLARGEGRIITQESMRELAADVKRRGRDRLAAEQPASR
jgi:Arc/MetJ-type ribon-helix-helix transcriptional regulator